MQTSTFQLDGLLRSDSVVPVGSNGASSTCSGKFICQWQCLSGVLGFFFIPVTGASITVLPIFWAEDMIGSFYETAVCIFT